MKTLFAWAVLTMAAAAVAAPDEPLAVDWFSGSPPPKTAFMAGPKAYMVTLSTNGSAYNFTGQTPEMWYASTNAWATTNAPAVYVTGTVSVVNSTVGTFRVTFSTQDFNPSLGQGNYRYGIGLTSNGYTEARQGWLTMLYSPRAAGVSFANSASNVNIAAYTFNGTFPTSTIPTEVWALAGGSTNGLLSASDPTYTSAVANASSAVQPDAVPDLTFVGGGTGGVTNDLWGGGYALSLYAGRANTAEGGAVSLTTEGGVYLTTGTNAPDSETGVAFSDNRGVILVKMRADGTWVWNQGNSFNSFSNFIKSVINAQ